MENSIPYQSNRRLTIILVVIMTIKILGFFTFLMGSMAVIQAFKLGLRMSMSFLVIAMYVFYNSKYYSVKVVFHNSMPFWSYSLYLCLAFASLLWTTNVVLSATQLGMTIDGFVYAYFFTKLLLTYNYSHPKNPISLSTILGYSIFLLVCWLIIGMLTRPDLYYRHTHGGEVARLGGLLQNPNEVGMLCVIGGIMIFDMIKTGGFKWYYVPMIVLLFYATYETQSRSSSASFLLISALYAFQSDSTWLKASFIFGMVFAGPFVFFEIFLKEGDMQEVMSMTGRTDFWRVLLTEGLPREPLLGNGYMRLSYTDYYLSETSISASMAHNTFIEVLMNFGLIGGFIVLTHLILLVKAIKELKDIALKSLTASMFLELMVNSMTEFGIFGHNNYGVLFFQLLIMSVLFSKEVRLSRLQKLRLKIAYQ